jgi:hypothetical protein
MKLCMAFTKITCPVDFSPGSQQAMRTAVRIANEHDAELVLVHSWYFPAATFAGDYVPAADIVQAISSVAEKVVRHARCPVLVAHGRSAAPK